MPVFKVWEEEGELINAADPRPGRVKIRRTLCCWGVGCRPRNGGPQGVCVRGIYQMPLATEEDGPGKNNAWEH